MSVTHFLDRIHLSQLRSLWHRLHNSAHNCEQFFVYNYFQCSQETFSEFCSLEIFTCLLQKMMLHRCLFFCTDTVHFHFLPALIRAVPPPFFPRVVIVCILILNWCSWFKICTSYSLSCLLWGLGLVSLPEKCYER